MKLLLAAGADVQYSDPNLGLTALHFAVSAFENNHETIVELIRAKANIYAKDIKGQTPFILLCGNGREDTIKIFLN